MSYLIKEDGRLGVEYRTWFRSVSIDSRTSSLDPDSNIITEDEDEDTSEVSEAQSSSESETSTSVSAS